MLDWLGGRYLREMAAIDNLTSVARQHIEAGEKLKQQLRLEQDVSCLTNHKRGSVENNMASSSR